MIRSPFPTPSAAASATLDVPVQPVSSPRAPATARAWYRRIPRPELLVLLVLAGVLDLVSLDRNGWANTYYSAAVRSMTTSWHAFLYNSFDPSGVMTLDKPPLATWIQALSARAFGFHPLAVLVPQALMGVATVALVYDLTRRRFGRVAGFVAGLALALTPMTVAISRHNNPDALLVLCCAAALWCMVRALEDGRTRWLVWAGVAIGLGFETKMLVAFIVVPAMVAAFLWVAPRGRRAALKSLAWGGGALAVVGGAWPLLLILTPASHRPWISGTSDNSILSLIFGYNGVGRVDGQQGGPGGLGGGGNGGPFGGSSGIGRLFNEALGGQAGWLLGVALVALVAGIALTRLRRSDARTGWFVLLGGSWLLSAYVFSEAKGIFHPYYVSFMAPWTAALVGAAAGLVLRDGARARWLAPAAVLGGVAGELLVLHRAPGFSGLAPVLIAGGLAAGAAVIWRSSGPVRAGALAAFLALLLYAPATWAFDTLGHATQGTFPSGGPASASAGGFGGGGGPGGGGSRPVPGSGRSLGRAGGTAAGGAGPFGEGTQLSGVLAYVKAHGGGTVAVSSQQGASDTIIASGAKVAGIGGFSGRESAVSISWLRDEVASGKVRWVVSGGSGGGFGGGGFGGPPTGGRLPGSGAGLPGAGGTLPGGGRLPGGRLGRRGGGDGRTGSTKAMAAVAKACRKVPSTAVSGGASGTLYDCAGRAGRL